MKKRFTVKEISIDEALSEVDLTTDKDIRTEDLLTKEIEIDFSERDWLIFSFFKVISKLKEEKPDELLYIQEIEEALHFFNNYVVKVEFTPHNKAPFKYKIDFNEEAEESRDFIEKKVKKLMRSPLIKSIIEKYIIDPKKQNLHFGISKKQLTRMSMHSVKQFYGNKKQLNLFSDQKVEEYLRDTGITLKNRPANYGVVLNQTQSRVYEAIIKAFSDTNYTGHTQVDKATYKNEWPVNKGALEKTYKHIDKIPVIRITQAQLIELSGYDLRSQRQGDKVDVVEAVDFLGSKQFCFYWHRLRYDEKGKPIIDKSGKYVKEDVMEISSIFRIKYVKDEKGLDLKYYEISPSAAIIDQVNNYFLLVPYNWREEVKQLTGKKASKYSYEFLTWLRLKFEEIRRHNNKGKNKVKPKPFRISMSWDEIAIELMMPETIYKANKRRAANLIKEAYSIAVKLGYLTKVEEGGATDILYLNEDFYPKPGDLI
jgi:hypothetical protein